MELLQRKRAKVLELKSLLEKKEAARKQQEEDGGEEEDDNASGKTREERLNERFSTHHPLLCRLFLLPLLTTYPLPFFFLSHVF